MAVLGKDLFDYMRPCTHVRVLFGEEGYRIEDMKEIIPYGAVLTELLNYDAAPYHRAYSAWQNASGEREKAEAERGVFRAFAKLPFYRFISFPDKPDYSELRINFDAVEHDLNMIQERYAWFLDAMYKGAIPEKKKGQRKEALALQIYRRCLDALVSGVSLGTDEKVDAPQINVQYEIVTYGDDKAELSEKMYFDRLSDFVYTELMKGIQKGFIPKRCRNCGRWFLQQPGMTFSYCGETAPGETNLTCRDIGAATNFREKVQNSEIWKIQQRAYKKYYARRKKGKMSSTDFERWSRESLRLRDEALIEYRSLHTKEEREEFIEAFREMQNRE